MHKYLLNGLLAIGIMSAATSAQAGDNKSSLYAGLRASFGITTFNDIESTTGTSGTCTTSDCDSNDIASLAAVVGYERRNWRIDANLEYSPRTDVENLTVAGAGSFDVNIAHLNLVIQAMYDYPVSEKLSIFGGLGVGATYYNAEDNFSGRSESGINPVFRGLVGVAYQFGPQTRLELGYTGTSLGETDIVSSTGNKATIGNIIAHEVRLGMIYKF